jgi:DNA-binding HxlR family transcriptional regulator
MSKKRSYRQNCALAIALDIIGERWSLLIVRELLIKPRRFGEILKNLPGMGTNLLTDRLQQLCDQGIIERESQPSSHPIYHLSTQGLALEDTVNAMIRWGMQFDERRAETEHQRDEWDLLPLRSLINPEQATQWHGAYRLHIGGGDISVIFQEGKLQLGDENTEEVASLTFSTEVAATLANGKLSHSKAMKEGLIQWQGSQADVKRFLTAFGL